MLFDVWLAKVPDIEYFYFHSQHASEDRTSSCFNMPDEYAHTDKRLMISQLPILNVELIGGASFEKEKHKNRIALSSGIY